MQQNGLGGVSDIDRAQALTLSPDGAHLYVVSPGSGSQSTSPGTIVVFTVDQLTGLLTWAYTYARTPAEPFGGGFDVAGSTDGRHLYLPALVDENVSILSRDPLTGALTFVGTATAPPPFQPIALALSADGANVYVVDGDNERLHTFSRDPLTGALTWDASLVVPGAADVIVSPDDMNVYATGRGKENGVHRYDRNLGSGALTFVDTTFDRSRLGADGLAISGDGTLLVSLSEVRDSVTLFERDGSGALSLLGADRYVNINRGVLSPDNQFVYAAGGSFRPIGIFRVTTFTCASTPLPGCKVPTLARNRP